MRKLRNFTLHPQGLREQVIAAQLGYDLHLAPEGVTVEPGRAGLQEAATVLANRLVAAAAEGSAVLIGGHTGLWIRTLDILNERGLRRPDLTYFDTRRTQDAEGRFVFQPEGLILIGPATASDE